MMAQRWRASVQKNTKQEKVLRYGDPLLTPERYTMVPLDFVNRPVPRQDLRRILYEALTPNTVTWGADFEKYEDSKNHVKVSFSVRVCMRCTTDRSVDKGLLPRWHSCRM